MKKEKVIETLSQFPKDLNLNDLFEKLLVSEKIERGLEQLKSGDVVSHEKVIEHFNKKWTK
jgi:hypothetical protein